jgi:glycosyltransferase involved in cell wall biosynthesis
MAGGNITIYNGLREKIEHREDVDSDWLEIQDGGNEPITRIPPFSLNTTLANSAVTFQRVRGLERQGRRYAAAYYFQSRLVTWLPGLRRRIPHLIAMDGTPLWYLHNRLWYEHEAFDPHSPLARLKRRATRGVYRGARYLLPLSESVRASLVEDYGISERKVVVVPPGIDCDAFCPPDRGRAAAREPRKVLFVGADFHRKGGDQMLALAERPEFRGVEFHLVTKVRLGPVGPNPVGPNVVVHGDIAPGSTELLRLLRQADLFVLPTRADSHSLASLEAMAMGLPVIVSRVGGIGDIVLPGVTGYFACADDTGRLAGQVRSLLGNDDLRLRMGRAARARVVEKFNLRRNAERVVELMMEASRDASR